MSHHRLGLSEQLLPETARRCASFSKNALALFCLLIGFCFALLLRSVSCRHCGAYHLAIQESNPTTSWAQLQGTVRAGGAVGGMKLNAPAADRNKQPILDVLRNLIPREALVLEVGSGTGQHAEWFAKSQPLWTWMPSEPDSRSRASVVAHTKDLTNVLPALDIDVTLVDWPRIVEKASEGTPVNIVFSANVIHIAPWQVCEGLLRGAGELMSPGGAVIFYGPFSKGGHHTAPSNEAFDQKLRAQDRSWGVRDIDDIATVAKNYGFVIEKQVDMPSNNFCLVLRKST